MTVHESGATPETGKRVSRPNPPKEWISVEVSELRIIDDNLWERVQTLKSRYTSHRGNRRQTKKRLLSGLVKCGLCGGGMTIERRNRYYCSARREKGTCDSDRGIAAQELEDRVLGGLRDILVGNEEMLTAFVEEFHAELARLRKHRRGQQHSLQKELQRVNRGIKRCLDFIIGGTGDPTSVGPELTALERRKSEIEAELRPALPEDDVVLHPNLPELYRRKVGELGKLLEDETARPRAMEIIRSLIERIEVHPGQERGNCQVILVGGLAQILAFAQQKNTAASGAGDGGTFLMVAGVGFEPTTFRL